MNIYSLVAHDHPPIEPKPELREQELLCNVPSNTVQSIRAFRVAELQAEAERLGNHFLYAYCGDATTKHQVLATLATAFHFPRHFGKNFDALSDCLTSLMFKAGPQPGFLVVIEQLPHTPKFDREARETLLDVFRDAADFWADKKVAFRVFYSFE
ncbi:barstar family protein [Lacisediminimonas profundi]|uniref:barstar family protein n=1 Tax=Lacisediminimonas profundi TaxID=2603856 RepID=UPI001F4FE637|nr:barstar family protein [Lacisediminimonas profundi]